MKKELDRKPNREATRAMWAEMLEIAEKILAERRGKQSATR